MAGCVFCEIIAGVTPASVVYRDDLVIAFMDIRPLVEGHLLVVPNQHISGLADIPPSVGAGMFSIGQRMASALRHSGLPCAGINFFLADGEAAGQTVFHAHLHVIPRHPGDGFGLRFPPRYGHRQAQDALEHQAEKIREALSRPPAQ
jgi:histidine triad (HIT) family protein